MDSDRLLTRYGLSSALDSSSLHLAVLGNRSVVVAVVDSLLDSSDSLVGKLLVFEHCEQVSGSSIQVVFVMYLQKASSSSVRLYVSGYMR